MGLHGDTVVYKNQPGGIKDGNRHSSTYRRRIYIYPRMTHIHFYEIDIVGSVFQGWGIS